MNIPTSVRSQLRFFAYFLGNRTLCASVLPIGDPKFDYSCIFDDASAMEATFAIWANTIDHDASGEVTNGDYAMLRAAQYIRSYIDPDYIVDPPFSYREQELH